MIRRVEKVLMILGASTLPIRGRRQPLYVALKRRLVPFQEFAITLKLGKVFLSGDSVLFDYAAFWDIFMEHCYDTDYHGALVIDIGAHKGYYSAYALLQGARKVYSFEPEGRNFQLLSKAAYTFQKRGYLWIIEKSAVGSRDDYVDLYITDRSWSHSIFPRQDQKLMGVERVPMRSFAAIIRETSKSTAEERIIVKINVEGAQCDIILGTPVEYWKHLSEVFVDFDSPASCRWDQLAAHLRYAGFELAKEPFGHIFHLRRRPANETSIR